ncbi:hypothetical protein F5051DRAFT_455877 [Lentinula edodes]|nr:hypothetical protein F5051DRAFT_455877 [Lentinula edodes]
MSNRLSLSSMFSTASSIHTPTTSSSLSQSPEEQTLGVDTFFRSFELICISHLHTDYHHENPRYAPGAESSAKRSILSVWRDAASCFRGWTGKKTRTKTITGYKGVGDTRSNEDDTHSEHA